MPVMTDLPASVYRIARRACFDKLNMTSPSPVSNTNFYLTIIFIEAMYFFDPLHYQCSALTT